jgi:cysteine-rich repeat protein
MIGQTSVNPPSFSFKFLLLILLTLSISFSCASSNTGSESKCGDNILSPENEECEGDDFNHVTCLSLNYYGGTLSCSSDCKINMDQCISVGRCGDEILHTNFGELCDTDQLNGASCNSLNMGEGELSCNDSCDYDTSQCSGAPDCGNNIIEGDEGCDGNDLADKSCNSLGLGDGNLSCTTSCIFDTTGCTSQPICGDGAVVTPIEECDDGDTGLNDGCDDSCQVESGWSCDDSSPSICYLIPDMPVITGEISAGHISPTWFWNSPANTDHFMWRLDSGAWQSTNLQTTTANNLSLGAHTLEVSACNIIDDCSLAATFTTTIQFLGGSYPTIWQGVSNPNLATTAIGNVVPISCHNCYNGPSNEIYTTAGALAKINNAISHQADLIELDICDAAGTMCVYHGETTSCTGKPTLSSLLADSSFSNSNSMLFIEIKESGLLADTFATNLLDILNSNRAFVKNGRPVFIRAFSGSISYLQAISNALPNYPLIENYFKFSVLYGKNSISAVADFQTHILTNIANNQFHMVEFDYKQKNLPGLTKYAQSLGLGVGVYTIPGSFGQVMIAALRDEVDQITAEYRIDQARILVEEENTMAYFNVADCASSSDTTMNILKNSGSGFSSTPKTVNVSPTASNFGTPALHYDGPGEDRFGCSLDFRSTQSITERALDLGTHTTASGQGFLVTAYVNFDILASLTGTMAILNSSEGGGFALELYKSGTAVYLRFGVRVGGEYRFHSYDISATGLSSPNSSINGSDAYFLMGAFDGDGGVYLFIDNEIDGNGGFYSGGVDNSGQPSLVGADPQPADTLNARFFFDGFIQQASVLAWGDKSFSGSVVND